MRWWRRYCCCCCHGYGNPSSSNDERPLSDSSSSSLVQHQHHQPSAFFCIPRRRHSSFNATTTDGTGGSSTSENKVRTSSSSSSGDDDDEDGHQRGRSWSTIPTTTDAERVSNKKKKPRSSSFSASSKGGLEKGVSFDRHILTEIAESDTTGGDEEEANKQPNDICGQITFSTAYDEQQLRLHVFVERASSLPKKSPQESYNTFVKMSILFSNTSKNSTSSLSTRTVKNTLSPIYKEDHVFHTNKSKWASTTQTSCLKLSLFDCDRQGRYDAIGHALLPLSHLSGGRKQKHTLPLTPMSIPTKKNLGQVLVGLSYLPTQSLLCVQVLKARHLTLDSDVHKRIHKDNLDTFVKVGLMCAGQKVKSNASRVVFGTGDPFYHFKNSFVLPPQFMLDASVIVSVVVRGILGRSFTLGRVVSGPYTDTGQGTPTHWGKMVQENRNVVQWRNLYL